VKIRLVVAIAELAIGFAVPVLAQQMRDTYKAVEVSAPGVLRVVERPVSEPGAGQVRIRVEACWNLSHRCRHGHRDLPRSEAAPRSWAWCRPQC